MYCRKVTYFIILATLTEVDLDTFWPFTRMIRSPLRSPESSALDAGKRSIDIVHKSNNNTCNILELC